MNSLIKIDWMPDETKLRQFGWFVLAGVSVVGVAVSILAPGPDSIGLWVVLGPVALAFGVFARVSPKRLKPFYLLVMSLAFVVTFPVALILGMFGFEFSSPAAPTESSESGDFGGNAGNIPEDGSAED